MVVTFVVTATAGAAFAFGFSPAVSTPVGQPVTVSFTLTQNGTPFDPFVVAAEVGLIGSGAYTSPAVVHDGTGLYHVTLTPLTAGTWAIRAVGRDSVGNRLVAGDAVFSVSPSTLPV